MNLMRNSQPYFVAHLLRCPQQVERLLPLDLLMDY